MTRQEFAKLETKVSVTLVIILALLLVVFVMMGNAVLTAVDLIAFMFLPIVTEFGLWLYDDWLSKKES